MSWFVALPLLFSAALVIAMLLGVFDHDGMDL